MACLARWRIRAAQASDSTARAFLLEIMQLICGSQVTPLDHFLLPEDDVIVKNYYRVLTTNRLSIASSRQYIQSVSQTRAALKWPGEHLDEARKARTCTFLRTCTFMLCVRVRV